MAKVTTFLLTLALVVIVGLMPGRASADYLYDLWNNQEEKQPYVMVVLDTSGSMSATDESGSGRSRRCPYGVKSQSGSTITCFNRIEGAQEVLRNTLPRIADEVGLGLMVFSAAGTTGNIRPPSAVSPATRDTCGARIIASPPSDYSVIRQAIGTTLKIDHNTPIAFSLEQANIEIKRIQTKEGASCRAYYVLLLTDGEENCAAKIETTAARNAVLTQVKSLRQAGIRTFVVGFGDALQDTDGSSATSAYARAGGTALSTDGEFVCWDDLNCKGDSTARAMFAYASAELEDALTRSFDMVRRGIFSAAEPVIASVPQSRSEMDRVRRNFMVYSAFETDGDLRRGHLYGIRLYKEAAEYSNDWQFTDMSTPGDVLQNCGPGETCVFDAGKLLAERVKSTANPRRIFTASPGTPDNTLGSFLVPAVDTIDLVSGESAALKTVWENFSSLTPIEKALMDAQLPGDLRITGDELREPTDTLLRDTVKWLHGTGRPWPLGDIFHASPAIIEPPAYGYRDRGYPQFRMQHARRPWMVYIGANDGMIHAFYGSPDLTYEADGKAAGIEDPQPRWEQGEEAWSYLPMNMIGRTLSEVKAGSKRFFSQDLSCRYTDMIIDDKVNSEGNLDCGDDPNCGWATVLLCGQGWGGSWYVAIDVTDPVAPRPMWELTIPGDPTHGDANGLGRTWSLPALNLINLDGKPTWTSIFGNGYNADMGNCPSYTSSSGKCSSAGGVSYGTRDSYRMLNMPFEGPYPQYGDGTEGDWGHAWLQDMASGRLLKRFDLHASTGNGQNMKSILADAASIDTDWNGMIDAAYLGGWDGSLARVYFGDKSSTSTSIGSCFANDGPLFQMGSSRPITSSPAVVVHPTDRDKVFLFVGSGINTGPAPDQQKSSASNWEFRAYEFKEDGSSTCPKLKSNAGNVCGNDDWKLTDNSRLMGSPLLSRQANGQDWLLYTTWAPTTKGCTSSGVARLACLNVTNPSSCQPCGDLTGDGTIERETIINTDGLPPTAPVMADGNVYVGPIRTPIVDVDGNSPTPGSLQSATVTISWREVF